MSESGEIAAHETSQDSGEPQRVGVKAETPVIVLAVAIALITIYIGMLAYLVTARHDPDWDRLVYLLSGFEALVFTGAGVLFGTTIQRANVAAAREDAADARQEAQTVHRLSRDAERQAMAGRALAAAIETKAEIHAQASPGIRNGRPTKGWEESGQAHETSADRAALAELAQLARAIFPR